MEYAELFNKALQNRSINQASKDWGVPQKTLNTYYHGRLPDFQTAMILAREAQVDEGEVMRILARHEATKKARSLFPDYGFAAALIITVNLFLTPTPAKAAPVLEEASSTLYIMSNRMRKLTRRIAATILRKAIEALKHYDPAPCTTTS